MTHPSSSHSGGTLLRSVLLLAALFLVAAVIYLSFGIEPSEMPTEPLYDDWAMEPVPSGSVPKADEPYYHRPILVTSDATCGAGLAIWRGLCGFLEESMGLMEPEEALYLCDDTAEAICATVDRAVREMVPSIIVLEGGEAAEAVAQLQETYRGTFFLVLNGQVEQPEANTCCVQFAAEQAGFLAGYGAVMEGFGSLAMAAEADSEQADRLWAGFVQGAELAAESKQQPVSIGRQPEDAELIFCCGSLDYQRELAENAGDAKVICTVEPPFAPLSGEEEQSILTSAQFGFEPVTAAILRDWFAGGWEQFYGGKTLNYDLSWGEAVSLSTEPWGFSHFSIDLCRQTAANLAHGAYSASPAVPDTLTWVTLLEE